VYGYDRGTSTKRRLGQSVLFTQKKKNRKLKGLSPLKRNPVLDMQVVKI